MSVQVPQTTTRSEPQCLAHSWVEVGLPRNDVEIKDVVLDDDKPAAPRNHLLMVAIAFFVNCFIRRITSCGYLGVAPDPPQCKPPAKRERTNMLS